MLNIQTVSRLLPILALLSGIVSVFPAHLARSQSLPGFTLFSGVDPSNQLSYRLDSGNRNAVDRYRLKIPGSKVNRLGAAQIQITPKTSGRSHINGPGCRRVAEKTSSSLNN